MFHRAALGLASSHQFESIEAARLAFLHCQMTSLAFESYLLLLEPSFGALLLQLERFDRAKLIALQLSSGAPPPLKRVCHVELTPPGAFSTAQLPLPQLYVS